MTLPTISRLFRRAALFAVSGSLLATSAQARVGEVCLELPSGASTVKARIASGCLPTTPRYEGAFAIEVDTSRAVIAITGGFTQIGEARVATADCMGSRVLEQEAEAAGPRRYSVLVNGRFVGVLDASDTEYGMRAVTKCFAGRSQVRVPSPEVTFTYRRDQFADWIVRDTSDVAEPATFPTLGLLAAHILGMHPETGEGRPSAEITISPAQWRRHPWERAQGRDFMAVRVEEHGYGDDSVSGKRSFAAAQFDPESGAWRIAGAWYQWMCSRGERAGQWSAEPCP